ncbi:hypothetical protein ACEWY4_021510 [Coilia grayii]|uniref:Gypsy retrotransposon integrase-like protein 1 n=1 Tax=Coilia grayii TaxID=363190 RepID=A0ABD1J962_9TELE
MLESGIVEPSFSGWASPVVLVPKKDGFCMDYRKLNAVTETDVYPLPNITELLELLTGTMLFSTLDLNSGYWQVTMDSMSKAKTAFITSAGLFQFQVMPFGLKNAPATFQRQHFQDLQAVLDKLQGAGLTVNLKKCKFCLSQISYLGHVVTAQGISADPAKTEAISHYPVPRNIKEVQRFLGLNGWYHRFVPGFSQVAEPINALKRKGRMFHWSDRCQEAFDTLKGYLTSPPILGHPDPNYPFVVYTDASDVGLGAVLAQRKGSAIEEVIAYASRSLNRAERNYSTTERECLAVIWALEKWQHYLEPKLFTVVTDHASLQWVLNTTKTDSRLIRWALRLQKFNFAMEYRKGTLNAAPDALSRCPVSSACVLMTSSQSDQGATFPVSISAVREEQQKDCEVQKIIKSLAEGCAEFKAKYAVVDDLLYRINQRAEQIHYRLMVPKSLTIPLLQSYHESPLSGHQGIFKTYKRLYDVVFWPTLWTDIKDYIRACTICQTHKADNRKPCGTLQQTQVSQPNQMVGVDIMGPFPRSSDRKEYLVVFVDYYTRWVELFPIRSATAQTISRLFREEFLTRWGVPNFLLSDRGSQFVSSLFQELCAGWTVIPKLTTAYHPQTNLTDRVNRNIKAMISSYVGDQHNKWTQYLPEFRFALNSSVHETTGVSPAELHLGRKLKSPMDKLLLGRNPPPDTLRYDVEKRLRDLQEQVAETSKKAKQRQLCNYNKKRREVTYHEKDRVWVLVQGGNSLPNLRRNGKGRIVS